MNRIQKIFVYIGLIILFLFAFSANKIAVSSIQPEKNKTSFSVEKNHSSVFIEPRAHNSLSSTQKKTDFSVSKYLENFLAPISNLKISNTHTFVANQDINRCEMVSLLLFPFHFFW